MLSIYAKWKGGPYLKATLQKVLERLMLTSKDLDLELDPARVPSPEELQKNALQLRIVTKVFIDDICASSANIPPSFRKICSIVSSVSLIQPCLALTDPCPRFPKSLCQDFRRQSTRLSGPSYSSDSSVRLLLRRRLKVLCRLLLRRRCGEVCFSSRRSSRTWPTTSSLERRSLICSR